MGLPANFDVTSNDFDCIVLCDLGPWTKYYTITNDAENVVQRLFDDRLMADNPNKRILYLDSNGEKSELIHNGNKFLGFK